MTDVRVAWWNLENLFDHENAPRPPALKKSIAKDLKGWSVALRDKKIEQLASIVELMFNGEGPDLLGVCEVENETVLQLLVDAINMPDRNYKFVSHASPDARGIDISMIADEDVLEVTDTGHQVVVKRTGTRDIFFVELTERSTGNVLIAIGNHWPARSAGQYESEPFRMITGETCSFVLDDLMEQFDVGKKLPVLVMGDFNDEPFNRSMQEYLLGTRDPARVTRATSTPRVLNLMWPLMQGHNPGTFKFGSDWRMFDQFLASKGMLSGDVKVDPDSVAIFKAGGLDGGSDKKPRRFGLPKGKVSNVDQDGFSDHFPITVVVKVKT